mgnify:CR=1 FL=1
MKQGLFELVKSMTQSEKRYFRIEAAKQAGDQPQLYMMLFEAIEACDDYSEKQFKELHRNAPFIGQFALKKHHLQLQIMKSLRAFNNARSAEMRVTELMQNILILYDKGLYAHCRTAIRKAVKLSTRYEFHALLIWLHEFQRRILKKEKQTNMREGLEVLLQEKDDHLKNLDEKLSQLDQYDRLFIASRTTGKIPEESLNASANFRTVLGELYTLQSLALQAHLRKDYLLARDEQEKIVLLWEKHADMAKEYRQSHRTSLANYLVLCYSTGQMARFPEYLERIRKIPSKSFDEEAEAFQNLSYLELLYFTNTGQIEGGLSLTNQISKGLKRYARKINVARHLVIRFNVASLCFIAADFKQSLTWCNSILQVSKTEHRRDIQGLVRIIQLLIHYELDNHELLEYQLRTTREYFGKQKEMQPEERLCLAQFRKLLKTVDATQRTEVCTEWLRKLEELIDSGSTWQAAELCSLWLKANIQGRMIVEIAKEELGEKDEQKK